MCLNVNNSTKLHWGFHWGCHETSLGFSLGVSLGMSLRDLFFCSPKRWKLHLNFSLVLARADSQNHSNSL